MPSDTSAPQECHDKNKKDQDNHHTSEERTRGLFDKNEKDQYNEKDQWDEKTKVRGGHQNAEVHNTSSLT